MTYIDEFKEKLNHFFMEAGLSEKYALFNDEDKPYSIDMNMYQRFVIQKYTIPYSVEDIQNIHVLEENNKSSKMVEILFNDDVLIDFHEYGISMSDNEIEYHSTDTVLGRLYYKYKTKVCGIRINPLVIKNNVVIAYCGNAAFVKIPEGVKKIGDCAFEHSNVEKVHIPSSLNELCEYCFNDCKLLSDIKFNEQEEFIGEESQNIIRIPPNIRKIGKYSFLGCDRLPKIEHY